MTKDGDAGSKSEDVEDDATTVKGNVNNALANLYKPKIGVDRQSEQSNVEPPPHKNVGSEAPMKSAGTTALVKDDASVKAHKQKPCEEVHDVQSTFAVTCVIQVLL